MQLGDYSIRPIEESDLDLLLKWRNSERIHSLMLTDHKITWDEHNKWFKKISEYNPKRNFVFEYKGMLIGYMGYTEFDEINKTCSPGGYIGELSYNIPEAGLVMAYFELEYAFENLKMKSLISTIFAKNKRVYKLNLLLGYKVIATKHIIKNGIEEKIFIIELNYDKWVETKEKLINFIK